MGVHQHLSFRFCFVAPSQQSRLTAIHWYSPLSLFFCLWIRPGFLLRPKLCTNHIQTVMEIGRGVVWIDGGTGVGLCVFWFCQDSNIGWSRSFRRCFYFGVSGQGLVPKAKTGDKKRARDKTRYVCMLFLLFMCMYVCVQACVHVFSCMSMYVCICSCVHMCSFKFECSLSFSFVVQTGWQVVSWGECLFLFEWNKNKNHKSQTQIHFHIASQ